jgi:hypothetical protein
MPEIKVKIVGPHTSPTASDLATDRAAAHALGVAARPENRTQEAAVNAGAGGRTPEPPAGQNSETMTYPTPPKRN